MKDHWGPMPETTKNDERPKDALAVLCGLWRRLFPSPTPTRLAHDDRHLCSIRRQIRILGIVRIPNRRRI